MDFKREDVIWAAGLIEGEGCFTSHTNQPYLLVDMTDEDVIHKLHSIFPFGIMRGPYHHKKHPNNKPRYRFDAFGKSAYAIAIMIYPFLCSRRQEKITELIKKWK